MAITINIYYTGEGNSARLFAEEMLSSGTVDEIRSREGNLRYEYYFPFDDESTLLLIDSWESQECLDLHHRSHIMEKIIALREKYNLHMRVERYISDSGIPDIDEKYIRK